MLPMRQVDTIEEQLEYMRRRIVDRVTDVFTSKPTWSRMPFVDHETFSSIEQVINEEFDRHKRHIDKRDV